MLTLIGLLVIAILVLIGVKNIPKTHTVGTLGDYEITLNKTVEISETGVDNYIIIPVNSDFKKVRVFITRHGQERAFTELEEVLLTLDTLRPNESEHTFKLENDQITIKLIVADNLR